MVLSVATATDWLCAAAACGRIILPFQVSSTPASANATAGNSPWAMTRTQSGPSTGACVDLRFSSCADHR